MTPRGGWGLRSAERPAGFTWTGLTGRWPTSSMEVFRWPILTKITAALVFLYDTLWSQEGDRVIGVDQQSLESLGYSAALELLQKAGPTVTLLVSQLRWNTVALKTLKSYSDPLRLCWSHNSGETPNRSNIMAYGRCSRLTPKAFSKYVKKLPFSISHIFAKPNGLQDKVWGIHRWGFAMSLYCPVSESVINLWL